MDVISHEISLIIIILSFEDYTILKKKEQKKKKKNKYLHDVIGLVWIAFS